MRCMVDGLRAGRGQPLLFLTVNPADVRSAVLLRFVDPALLREAEGLDARAALDLFETSAAAVPVPCSADMHRMVARDPVAAVRFFYHIVRGVLRDLLGVEAPVVGADHLPADGCAWSGRPCMFGGVDAVFGVTETQNRGTLHLHAFVWVLRSWQASDPIDAIRERYYGPNGLRERFLRWVEWTSYESVATLPAKLDVPEDDADTTHLGPARRPAGAEDDAASASDAAGADAAQERWRERSGREVTEPLTGATASRLGPFGKSPGFYYPPAAAAGPTALQGAAGGRGTAHASSQHGPVGLSLRPTPPAAARAASAADAGQDAEAEALEWVRAALDDARDVAGDMGVHGCRPGCWARRRGVGVVCRHGYFHLEPDGERLVVRPGKPLVPDPADANALLEEQLAARVDAGIDAGGYAKGAVLRVRTHRWETRSMFAVALACRCNHDCSILEHVAPDADGDADDLARALNETRDGTAAAVYYVMYYITKDSPDADRVFDLLSRGVDRLRRELDREAGGAEGGGSGLEWKYRVRRTLNRMLVSTARRRVRPMPELVQQLLGESEMVATHQFVNLFVQGLLHLVEKAAARAERGRLRAPRAADAGEDDAYEVVRMPAGAGGGDGELRLVNFRVRYQHRAGPRRGEAVHSDWVGEPPPDLSLFPLYCYAAYVDPYAVAFGRRFAASADADAQKQVDSFPLANARFDYANDDLRRANIQVLRSGAGIGYGRLPDGGLVGEALPGNARYLPTPVPPHTYS